MSVAPLLSIREYTYRILGHIGQGDRCSVYRASVEHLDGTEVAIKIVSPKDAGALIPPTSSEIVDRFHDELGAHSALCGGPLPGLFDFRLEGQSPFIITKWAGSSIFSSLSEARGPLATPDAELFIQQLFRALADLHSLGYAHGSLHPAHVLLANNRVSFCSLAAYKPLHAIGSAPLEFHPSFRRFSAGELDCILACLIAFQVATGIVPLHVLQSDPEDWIPHIIPPPRYINPTLSIRVEHLLLRGLNFGRGVPPSSEDLSLETAVWSSLDPLSVGRATTNDLFKTPAGLSMSNDSDNPLKRGGDRISRTHPTLGDDSELARASRAKTELISAQTMNQLREDLIAQALAQTTKEPAPPAEEPAPSPKGGVERIGAEKVGVDPAAIVGFSRQSQIPPHSQPLSPPEDIEHEEEEEPLTAGRQDDFADSETEDDTSQSSGTPPWAQGVQGHKPSSLAAGAFGPPGKPPQKGAESGGKPAKKNKTAQASKEFDAPHAVPAVADYDSLPPARSRSRIIVLTVCGVVVGGLLAFYLTASTQKRPGVEQKKPPSDEAANKSPLKVDNRSLFPGISSELTFPQLPSGLYSGIVKDIIPNTKLPIVITSFDNGKRISVILGIEGFMPTAVELAPDATDIRITANGLSLRFTGEARGSAIGGTVENLFTREVGVWKAVPIQ